MSRVLTAALAIPLTLSITYWAPPWLFSLVVAAVAAVALDEFFGLTHGWGLARPARWALLAGSAVTLSFYGGTGWTLGAVVGALLLLMTVSLFDGDLRTYGQRVMVGLTGILYTCGLAGFLILLPRSAIFVLFGIIWLGDSAAYYGGRWLGRHRLSPRISPGKTVEGAIAGAVASVGVGAFLGHELLALSYSWLLAVSLITAAAGQVGDLAESALKRAAQVKDSAATLPGHGGFLDRIDSLLFAAPVFYALLRV